MNGRDQFHAPARHVLESVIALRFRPIAPKPVAGDNFSGQASPKEISSAKRAKRKYVRVCNNNNNKNTNPRRRNKDRSDDNGDLQTTVSSETQTTRTVTEKPNGRYLPELGSNQTESWVTVEHVTEDYHQSPVVNITPMTWSELEGDTCPAFVSDDSMSKVELVNAAYRRMVNASGEGHVAVCLSLDHYRRRSVSSLSSFTCRVRVEYHVTNNDNYNNNNNNNNDYYYCYNYKKEKYWKIMPCDVWKLENGGFAWRLDVKAALGLGL